jgi:putative membrane protein
MLLLDVIVAQAGIGSFLLNMLLSALVLMGAAHLLNGVEIKDFTRALLLALALAFLNATVGWLLHGLATPVKWITFGIFNFLISLVISAVVIKIADYFMKGFSVRNFGWALLLATILALANALIGGLVN